MCFIEIDKYTKTNYTQSEQQKEKRNVFDQTVLIWIKQKKINYNIMLFQSRNVNF